MLRKVAFRGVIAGGAAYGAYSFLKPVETQVDFSGSKKKARLQLTERRGLRRVYRD